jgi:D-alanyl-D-alanine carboxypeptidase/D-alanyl-D-alanine-endopeptidase (penicillin-binding protein 4)
VLSSIVRDINKMSNNTMARNLFLTLGATEEKPPSTPAKSASAIEAFLRRDGIDMQYLALENGSGLTRDERVTAVSLADLLQRANASPVAQVFIDSLPIAGVDGTMRHRLTNQGADGNAHIKTGTLHDVRAIAGYVASADGNSYVVVSLINDPHAEAARAAHDALLEWVYGGPEQGFTKPLAEPVEARGRPRKNPHKRGAH